MYELSPASGIFEAVPEGAESCGIGEVQTVVGERACREADQLKFCFRAITRDAALEIDVADAARTGRMLERQNTWTARSRPRSNPPKAVAPPNRPPDAAARSRASNTSAISDR